jgi:uncharacterized repeat protein (TIGR02543 family)
VNVKLYAQWTQHIYEVNYEPNGHGDVTSPNPATVTYGALLTAPAITADAGWNFTAWYEDVSLKKPWDFADGRMPAKGLTLYAGWHSDDANFIEFNVNGHGTTPAAVWVEPGGWLDEPELGVSEQGYTFGGWYGTPACTPGTEWDFTVPIPVGTTGQTIQLYAKWTLNKYDVSFDMSGYGGSVKSPYSGKHEFGKPIPEPSPEPARYGYVFDGWYGDEFTSGAKWVFATATMPAIDLTLYATWEKGVFTASFDMNGHGAPGPADQQVTFGAFVAAPAPPSDAIYVFGGWFTTPACSAGTEWDFVTDTMPGENLTLYAKWTADAYMAYFVMNGHGGQAPNPVRAAAGQRIPEPARPYDANWAFTGWYTDMACSPGYEWNFAVDTMPRGDMTLFAKWARNAYTVSFHMNGHGGKAPASERVEAGAYVPEPIGPTENGYTFGGWFTTQDCREGTEWRFKTDKMPDSDLRLYAKWTEKSESGGNGNNGGGGGNSGNNNGDKNNDDNKGGKGSGAEGGSAGSGNGGSGSNSNAEGGGEGTTADAIDGIAGDDDTYGEAGADNASGEDSEWNTNGGSAEAGDDENSQGGKGEEPMSIANILLMVAGIVIAIFIATNAKRRRYAKWLPPTIIALGAIGVILYFAIERIHSNWTIINSHTIYFAIIIAAQIAATIISRRAKVDSGTSPE